MDRGHELVLTSSSPLPIADVELPGIPPFKLVVFDTVDVDTVDEGIDESGDVVAADDDIDPALVLELVSKAKKSKW